MRIFRVAVTYGELRSTGHPAFSNVRHEVHLAASLEEGDTAEKALTTLESYAKSEVKRLFGDKQEAPASEMQTPYHRPESYSGV